MNLERKRSRAIFTQASKQAKNTHHVFNVKDSHVPQWSLSGQTLYALTTSFLGNNTNRQRRNIISQYASKPGLPPLLKTIVAASYLRASCKLRTSDTRRCSALNSQQRHQQDELISATQSNSSGFPQALKTQHISRRSHQLIHPATPNRTVTSATLLTYNSPFSFHKPTSIDLLGC